MMGGNGGGWGQSQGDAPTRLSAQERLDLARRLQGARRLQELAAMCGRLTQIALQVQRTKVQHPPDEITSITVTRDVGASAPVCVLGTVQPVPGASSSARIRQTCTSA